MAGVDLGDRRLNQRVPRMLQGRWERPTNSFSRSFQTPADTKGAFQLIENKRWQVNFQSLLASHRLQTARRMAAENVVLVAQDTTALSYNQLQQTEALGPIGET